MILFDCILLSSSLYGVNCILLLQGIIEASCFRIFINLVAGLTVEDSRLSPPEGKNTKGSLQIQTYYIQEINFIFENA